MSQAVSALDPALASNSGQNLSVIEAANMEGSQVEQERPQSRGQQDGNQDENDELIYEITCRL